MATSAVLVAVSAVGTIFYLRFLVALHREWKRGIICYLVRIEPEPQEIVLVEPAPAKQRFLPAA